jgi:hypothetical protein
MSRSQGYSQHQQQHHRQQQHQQQTAPNVLVQQMLRKEQAYRTGIKDNQSLANALAQRLNRGGELETLMGEDALSDYRARLKTLAEQNVQQDRHLSAFLQALGKSVGGNNGNNENNMENYQVALEEAMETEIQTLNRSSVHVHQEQYYLDMLSKLGESTAHTNNTAAGGAAGGNDDDDDLEVLDAESTVNLKCPLTSTLMVDPLKNKMCRHIYSKIAIFEHLKHDRKCPVFGCRNHNVTSDQLEPDMETAHLVRREKIRQQHEQQQQNQNAIDMDDDDDDDEYE